MSERSPVTIDLAEWTRIYETRGREGVVLLHRQADNVFLIYSESSLGEKPKAGFVVESGHSEDVVRAVRRACGAINRMDLVPAIIAKLPAEKL